MFNVVFSATSNWSCRYLKANYFFEIWYIKKLTFTSTLSNCFSKYRYSQTDTTIIASILQILMADQPTSSDVIMSALSCNGKSLINSTRFRLAVKSRLWTSMPGIRDRPVWTLWYLFGRKPWRSRDRDVKFRLWTTIRKPSAVDRTSLDPSGNTRHLISPFTWRARRQLTVAPSVQLPTQTNHSSLNSSARAAT